MSAARPKSEYWRPFLAALVLESAALFIYDAVRLGVTTGVLVATACVAPFCAAAFYFPRAAALVLLTLANVSTLSFALAPFVNDRWWYLALLPPTIGAALLSLRAAGSALPATRDQTHP